MRISATDVRRIAELARLELTPNEAETLGTELDTIVDYVKLLDDADTSGVLPTSQVAVQASPLRPDVTTPSLAHDQALQASPRTHSGTFVVPGFVEG